MQFAETKRLGDAAGHEVQIRPHGASPARLTEGATAARYRRATEKRPQPDAFSAEISNQSGIGWDGNLIVPRAHCSQGH